jgi:hypothetical protein
MNGQYRCKCHSSALYDTLRQCPACGHWSLDVDAQMGWEGCERRSCGYQKTRDRLLVRKGVAA